MKYIVFTLSLLLSCTTVLLWILLLLRVSLKVAELSVEKIKKDTIEIILGTVLVCGLWGYFYYLTNR